MSNGNEKTQCPECDSWCDIFQKVCPKCGFCEYLLKEDQKKIEKAVNKAVEEYGETLKLLTKE